MRWRGGRGDYLGIIGAYDDVCIQGAMALLKGIGKPEGREGGRDLSAFWEDTPLDRGQDMPIYFATVLLPPLPSPPSFPHIYIARKRILYLYRGTPPPPPPSSGTHFAEGARWRGGFPNR
jgi:hypothetical protein